MASAGRGGNSDHRALRTCRADNCSDVCPDEGGNGRHGRNRGGPPNEECFSCMQASCEIPQDILDRRDCVMNTCSAQCSADHSSDECRECKQDECNLDGRGGGRRGGRHGGRRGGRN